MANTMVAVVTGASRGAGKGIALAFGKTGATVYVTGRGTADPDVGGTVAETAAAITAAGGRGVAVEVDHRNDDAVAALFERVNKDHGRLDILVNNAASVPMSILAPVPFWQKPIETVELITVGLRSHFVAS